MRRKRAFHTAKVFKKPENERGPLTRIDRKCLGCGDVFKSDGIHNRLCTPCSRNDEGFQEVSLIFSVV